jgi:hypothetical protein
MRIKQFVWSKRRGPFQHQVALDGGVKAPTAPLQNDDHGLQLPSALQPGMGSVTPFAGLFYGLGRGPWSFYGSFTVYLPFPVREGAHAADSLRSSASVQRQVGRKFAARFGLDTRLDASAEANGKPDPNSGGFVAYLSPAPGERGRGRALRPGPARLSPRGRDRGAHGGVRLLSWANGGVLRRARRRRPSRR